MNLKVTYRVKNRSTAAELLRLTKHLELCPTVMTEGMDYTQVKEAFTLLDLVNAEFQSDPMSTQCFDLRIRERIKELIDKWNERGRP